MEFKVRKLRIQSISHSLNCYKSTLLLLQIALVKDRYHPFHIVYAVPQLLFWLATLQKPQDYILIDDDN